MTRRDPPAAPHPRRLSDCHSIMDLRALAARRLPRPLFDYIDGGAETEWTARRNVAAFDDATLVPRCLVDVSEVSTRTRVLGQDLEWPLICAPTGASRFYHPDGERAVARAAAASGVLYALSTMATQSLEEVAAASSGPRMFQLYIFKDRGITRELIARCKAAGYGALCLTVDAAVRGKRERELRAGLGVPLRLTLRGMAGFARRPAWLMRHCRTGRLSMPNFAAAAGSDDLAAQTRFVSAQLDASLTWDDVAEMIGAWGGPFAIKGIMSPDDARRAAALGATAVIVSNHGGRQLDGAPAPFDMLPAIAEAVQGRVEIILDGGVRRGVHIVKALLRGATACSIGRPCLYGLAAAGEPGVARALDILHDEFARALRLAGFADVRVLAAPPDGLGRLREIPRRATENAGISRSAGPSR